MQRWERGSGCVPSPERTSLGCNFPVNRENTGKNVCFEAILVIFSCFGSESHHNNSALLAISLLIEEQGK